MYLRYCFLKIHNTHPEIIHYSLKQVWVLQWSFQNWLLLRLLPNRMRFSTMCSFTLVTHFKELKLRQMFTKFLEAWNLSTNNVNLQVEKRAFILSSNWIVGPQLSAQACWHLLRLSIVFNQCKEIFVVKSDFDWSNRRKIVISLASKWQNVWLNLIEKNCQKD